MKRSERENKDRSITVRFSKKEAEALSTIAGQYNMTVSDVIRCSIAGELCKYLGKVKYVDPKQGNDIRNNTYILIDAIAETRDYLRRIGVNINQIIRRINAGDTKALSECGKIISKKELDNITCRLEKVTREAGEIVSCIAG